MKVIKQELLQVLQVYQNHLNEKFVNRMMTPNTIEIMTREIDTLRKSFMSRETNPVWTIPVEIVPRSLGRFEINPIIPDGVELIDRPHPTKTYARNNY